MPGVNKIKENTAGHENSMPAPNISYELLLNAPLAVEAVDDQRQ